MDILNVITQLLAYKDAAASDNPTKRSFDWTRKLHALAVNKPSSDTKVLAPGEVLELFSGVKATSLSGASTVAISLLSGTDSIYRLSVTAGPSGFRTARTPSGISACTVTINNNAVAVFDFTAATLTGVVSGDIMRIKGQALYDTGPFVFNPLNSGLWKVLSVSGTQVQAVRPTGVDFTSAAEVIVSGAATDVEFYSATGIQKGEKMAVSGTFSSPVFRTYEVQDATADTVDFISTTPLPLESGLTYVTNSIAFYTNAKKLVYLEVDQEAVVRFNEDAGDSNKVEPVIAGDECAPGYCHKWGSAYKIVVVNKSVNSLNLRYFLAE